MQGCAAIVAKLYCNIFGINFIATLSDIAKIVLHCFKTLQYPSNIIERSPAAMFMPAIQLLE